MCLARVKGQTSLGMVTGRLFSLPEIKVAKSIYDTNPKRI